MKEKVITLESKLEKKNSSNSSIPPTKDENRVKINKSLQKGRQKTGGQKRSKCTTLKMHDNADHILVHKLAFCISCGEALQGPQELTGKRQVVDISPVKSIITEPRTYSTLCLCVKEHTSC